MLCEDRARSTSSSSLIIMIDWEFRISWLEQDEDGIILSRRLEALAREADKSLDKRGRDDEAHSLISALRY